MPQYLGSSDPLLTRSWRIRIRQLALLFLDCLRRWLVQKPLRCFQILLGLWKRLFGHVNRPRRRLIRDTANTDECGSNLGVSAAICASQIPDSAVNPTPETLTVFYGASHSNRLNASTSTFSDHEDDPVTITLPTAALHNPGASFHDIPFPRGSPIPSMRYISQNASTPNLPDMQRQRSRTPSAQRRYARPSSRVSGRPVSINNHSSAALVIVSVLWLL
jgi:hypothetical protein